MPVPAAGDEAVVCANEAVASNVASRIVISSVGIFMDRILPVTSDDWQATSAKTRERTFA